MSAPLQSLPPSTGQTIILPPEEEPKRGSPVWFILFAVVMIGGAAVAGLVQSGRISLSKYFGTSKAAVVATAGTAKAQPQAAHAAPPVPLKAGAFVVTSISLGQPSYAIINGASHAEGDLLDAPGASGWRVRRIDESVVWVQNGMTVTSIPLTAPGIKPLDDTLHPLN